eukprot:627933-Amphidinium_carterae.1
MKVCAEPSPGIFYPSAKWIRVQSVHAASKSGPLPPLPTFLGIVRERCDPTEVQKSKPAKEYPPLTQDTDIYLAILPTEV